jgi:hypothetical protein
LEATHVLGQRHGKASRPVALADAQNRLRRHAVADVFGQALRIALGALGFAVGVVPICNTGGTDTGMFKRLPHAPDLAQRVAKK